MGNRSGAMRRAIAVDPYGTNDAGGFRNVLPPGEAGVDNAAQLAAFTGTGALPPHWDDQQPLYDGLIDASAQGNFGQAQVLEFYKDATFGVPNGEVERTETPRAGVTILRDQDYGVPHVYGVTRDDTIFGAGYVNADLYGHGDCSSTPEPNCWDLNRSTIASGISLPPAPFQNRPTFQQTVSIKHPVP